MSVRRDCQAFVVHMRAEHKRLHEQVRSVEQVLSLIQEKTSKDLRGKLINKLSTLRDTMQHHFAEEDAGGCLEEAACRCPELVQIVTQLEHEHSDLLQALDRIIRSAKADPSRVRDVFPAFHERLEAHETAENKVLATGFQATIEDI